jgi:glycosyltransferase involved in cell wall biosynthesis
MKIAQIAPLFERVPPRLYGGTERVVSYLTEELVRQGHDVTLFASGDSQTSARLVRCCDLALRLNPAVKDGLPYHVMMIDAVRQGADEFDILHFHIDLFQFPVMRDYLDRTVTTMHGRLDLPDLKPFYSAFSEYPLVSISHDQRKPLPRFVNWVGNVHHGLPSNLLSFTAKPKGGYLAFLGRISAEKGPDRAIEIAARAGMPLKIAAKVDRADEVYWNHIIAPMIKAHRNVEYIGEINEQQKGDFLGNAAALLFPIDWPEPFGLVTIEAMACGTPVIAFRAGSVTEVIEDDLTGFIVGNIDEAVAAVSRLDSLDRRKIRARFEERFSVERMAKQYVEIYRALIETQPAAANATRSGRWKPRDEVALQAAE